MRIALIYVASLLIMLILDASFLGLVAIPQFKAALGSMLLERPRIAPAVVFYLLYVAGILIFASLPAAAGDWGAIAWRGALFGLFAYATYDLTNYATLVPWTFGLVAMDLVWGTVVTAVAATGGAWLGELVTRLLVR